jgi:hypothetical protein
MSALWHDADYLPEKRFETPTVEKGLDDMALPNEQHQLPEGVTDPFAKLDEVYDVAAAQMERGIRGTAFLNGKPAPEHRAVESIRTDLEQVRMTNQAAAVTIPKSKTATKTAADAEAVNAAPHASSVGDAVGAAATFIPMAAGQAVASVAQGPLPALATQAITVTSAAVGAAQVTAAGIAEGLKEEEPVVVRRGLSKK